MSATDISTINKKSPSKETQKEESELTPLELIGASRVIARNSKRFLNEQMEIVEVLTAKDGSIVVRTKTTTAEIKYVFKGLGKPLIERKKLATTKHEKTFIDKNGKKRIFFAELSPSGRVFLRSKPESGKDSGRTQGRAAFLPFDHYALSAAVEEYAKYLGYKPGATK